MDNVTKLRGSDPSPPEFADAARAVLEAIIARGAIQLVLIPEFREGPTEVEIFAVPETAAVRRGLIEIAKDIVDGLSD